ncbi:MAG: chorismate mutase [Actinomycetota bacterium]|jgi:chorismate mutase
MTVRGIRGATMLNNNDADELNDAVIELLQEIFNKNNIDNKDLISIFFTSTKDLNCAFPAAAARKIGLGDVPLICSQEIDVPNSPAKVVRILMHVNTEKDRDQIKHIYLRGAEVLRQDLAQ